MEECSSLLLQKVDPEIKAAVNKAALHFKKYGIEPKKVNNHINICLNIIYHCNISISNFYLTSFDLKYLL